MYIKFKLQNKPQNFNVFTLKIELTMLLPISAPAPKMAALPNLLPNFLHVHFPGSVAAQAVALPLVVIVVVAVVVGTVEVGSN